MNPSNSNNLGNNFDGAQVPGRIEVQPPEYQPEEPDDIVQVVYQSGHNGSMVAIGSSLVSSQESIHTFQSTGQPVSMLGGLGHESSGRNEEEIMGYSGQQVRAGSMLPSVAEENVSSSAQPIYYMGDEQAASENEAPRSPSDRQASYYNEPSEELASPYQNQEPMIGQEEQGSELGRAQPVHNPDAIYSVVNKSQMRQMREEYGQQFEVALVDPEVGDQGQAQVTELDPGQYCEPGDHLADQTDQGSLYSGLYALGQPSGSDYGPAQSETSTMPARHSLADEREEGQPSMMEATEAGGQIELNQKDPEDEHLSSEGSQENLANFVARHKSGAAESGSFRHNFRKKLAASASSNENELSAQRQKLLELQVVHSVDVAPSGLLTAEGGLDQPSQLPKFKRNHSVSFNVGRGARHSIDIRNLPSYLTVKRASVVDLAKGAMSSLINSFGSGTGSALASSSGGTRRDSSPDEEPIFEEPIAPTLSLGQRVALVRSSGAEFGTVGWIGQLPDVDDDWIVGVIFDNMIGDCDGAYKGIRYFYARENYAMFVPLSTLTKTDNYIGRPETGTMLSRMSISLKPGQLISIQRSSIRLQHCFLNAPHQRVGHDVRAVSNRLHCQCHNCGPCAHLTKQGRVSAIPPFGTHHVPNKKNSLAHAAVEILAHHHHHYHEEEHNNEDEYQFGDNAAHACNFVRYSCCQQHGIAGHQFSADCQMVRPELLDNLIHAPKAPHRRSRPRRRRHPQGNPCGGAPQITAGDQLKPLSQAPFVETEAGQLVERMANLDVSQGHLDAQSLGQSPQRTDDSAGGSSYSSRSSSSLSLGSSTNPTKRQENQNNPIYDFGSAMVANYTPNLQNTPIDGQMSIREQQRFVMQGESSLFLESQHSNSREDSFRHYNRRGSSLGSSFSRCLRCIFSRKSSKRRHRSARKRIIEYRRKQSTFVPSTLAKPQDDFASHGIMLPGYSPHQMAADDEHQNSDYSSFSRSSGESSPSKSPRPYGAQSQQTYAMEHEQPKADEQQLKSSHHKYYYYESQAFKHIDKEIDDFTLSDNSSYKKNNLSNHSAFTDLAYFDNSSEDTLKQLVDQAINEEVARPEPIILREHDISSEESPVVDFNSSRSSQYSSSLIED